MAVQLSVSTPVLQIRRYRAWATMLHTQRGLKIVGALLAGGLLGRGQGRDSRAPFGKGGLVVGVGMGP